MAILGVARRSEGDGSTSPRPVGAVLVGEVALIDADGRAWRAGGQQPQLVLAYLLLESRTVSRDELAELLWGDEIPTHWAGAVRGVLSKVRAALQQAGLGPEMLVVEGGTVRLASDPEIVTDVHLAKDAVERAGALLDRDAAADADEALELVREASRRLAGPFLATGDGDWVRRQQERVAELIRRAAAIEVAALLRSGRVDDAAERAAARVAEDPFDERAHHQRIEALLGAGRVSAAVVAYEQLADVLRSELGIAPSTETTALVASVDPASTVPATPPASGVTPASSARPPRARRSAWDIGSGRFVGRSHELDVLEAAWSEVVSTARPQIVVVAGHAGLGKSRLAAELSRASADHGAHVAWGRCRPSSGVPYEPIVEALREVLDDDHLLHELGPDAEGLVTLIPELRHRLPAATLPDDAAMARSQMQRSVVAAIDRWCTDPTLLVLDDLQWASADTMALLEVVLGAVARPILVLATYRGVAPGVEAGLARLQRLVPTTTLDLDGLDQRDIADLLTDLPTAGDQDQDRLVARTLHERTNGHPFLVTEIIDEARRRNEVLDVERIPSAARDWINRRVAELPPEVAGVLQLAAVVGLDVDLDLLIRCRADPEEVVLDRCEQLVAVGLLVESDEPGSFAFGHRITREVIHDSLGGSRRAVLHRTVGDALRSMPSASGRHRSVAEHYHRAGSSFLALAVGHQIDAGAEALAQSAWGLAEGLFDAAATSIRAEPDTLGAPRLLANALVGLGQARLGGGDRAAAKVALEEAVTIARAEHLPVELADAVLLLVGRAGRGAGEGMADAEQVAILREALAGLEGSGDDEDLAERRESLVLQLEGELVLALLFTDAVEERAQITTRAIERVREAQTAVPSNLARALLNARVTKLDPSLATERLADLDEVLALPVARLSPEQLVATETYRHEELLRLGRRAEAKSSLTRARALADQHRHPSWRWAVRTWEGLALLVDGDLEGAETAAFDAADLQVYAPEESLACLGVNLVSVRLLQGQPEAVVELMADAADRYPHIPCYRAVHSLCASEAGDRTGAEAAYRFFADSDFAGIPDDTNRFLTLTVLAHVAADLGDAAGGVRLDPLLSPYRPLQVVLNCYGGGGTYWGPATHALARLAALDGRADDATALFGEAAASADRFGAPLHLERIRRHAAVPVA
jgi:DNA-binding SARP family transcriptional activator